ncbi:MAG: DUF3783 domain-containing protein [Schwartzia sp.]|nr:DUF3783 domain-containing protein [Schwartzia sp. (in: firmicutes)]
MKKATEKALFYRFGNTEKLDAARAALRGLGIECRVLPDGSWREKVGFLLGLRGFQPAPSEEAQEFDFPGEVLLLYNIKGKRLDHVLETLKGKGVSPIRYKAVVTPFNILWTLRRLCETMKKEHAYMMEGVKSDDGEA